MDYLIHIAIFCCIMGILALSLNLVVGYTGLLSVTHAAFYGIGAYTTAILLTQYHLAFPWAVAMGVVQAALVALIIGWVLSRLSGDYYALGAVGFNIIVFGILLNWETVTRGPLGIPAIPDAALFGFSFSTPARFLVLALIALGLTYAVAHFVVSSSFGRVLKAIREDDRLVAVFGYHTTTFKHAIFTAAAGLAAVAGSLYATYASFIDPTAFDLSRSVLFLAMCILGGLGALRGSLAGAAALVVLPELLRFIGLSSEVTAQLRLLLYGATLVLLMRFRPQGLLGEYRL